MGGAKGIGDDQGVRTMAGDIRVRGKWAGTWVGVGQELWGGPRILGGVLSISLFIHF